MARKIAFVAEWPGLEKTAHWHARLASLYKETGQLNAAFIHFNKALDLDNQCYLALLGLSLSYKRLGLVETAIKWARQCTKAKPPDTTLDQTLMNDLATWLDLAGETNEAGEIFDRLLNTQPFSFWSIPNHLRFLSQHSNEDGMLKKLTLFLKKLEEQLSPGRLSDLSGDEITASQLSGFLEDLSDNMLTNEAIRKFVWTSKSISLAERIYLRSIDAARVLGLKVESAAIGHQLGVLYYQFSLRRCHDRSQAIEQWKRVLQEINLRGGTRVPEWVRECIEESLAKMYAAEFCQLLKRECKLDQRALDYLQQLKELTDDGSSLGQYALPRQVGGQIPSLLLGYCNRRVDRSGEARNNFRTNFKIALVTLSDDMGENDQPAHSRLRSTLLAAGDYENAAAAMYCTRIPDSDVIPQTRRASLNGLNFDVTHLHFSESDRTWNICPSDPVAKQKSEIEQKACSQQLAMPYSCDGDDHTDFLTEPFWTCTSCFHVDLCERCYHAFKNNEIPVKTCNPEHFLHVKPLQQVMKLGMITVGEKEIAIKDWLADIKSKWVGDN